MYIVKCKNRESESFELLYTAKALADFLYLNNHDDVEIWVDDHLMKKYVRIGNFYNQNKK